MFATIIGGLITAATSIVGGVMQTSATTAAGAEARQLGEQRREDVLKGERFGQRMQKAQLAQAGRAQQAQRQQYWTDRSDMLKQLKKQDIDKLGNRLTKRAANDFMLKQALFTAWGGR